MKNFKLFKRLGAFITAIAVLASMGTVAFADVAPQVEITGVSVAPGNDTGIYSVTVAYTVSGADVGNKGITLLAYGAVDNAELNDGEDFSVYNENDYKIAYVLQATEEPAELVEDGQDPQSYVSVGDHTISFNIDTTVEGAIKVGEGEKILVLLGGDKVTTPDAKLYPVPVVVSLEDAQGNEFEGFAAALDVDLGTTTIEAAVEAALAGYTLYIDEVATDFAVAVSEITEEGATHKAALKVDDKVVYEFNFSANLYWTADALAVSGAPYAIAAADIAGEDEVVSEAEIIAAVKAKVLEGTIKVTKGDLEATITDAEDAITVALKGTFDAATAGELTFDVTLAEGTYGEAIVGTEGLTTTVTVNYTLESAPEFDPGDVNGDGRVNNTDALWTFQAFKGKREFTEDQKALADVNNDGRVNNTDALWIFQAFKGKREL